MRSTFRVLFFTKKYLTKPDGTQPVMARITINSEKVAFSTKQSVRPKIWMQKAGKAIGSSAEATKINIVLDSIRNQLTARYEQYIRDGENPTPEMLKNDFLGFNAVNDTLLTVFADFNERHEKGIGIEVAQSTFNKYDLTYRRLQEYLQEKYHATDIKLRKINLDFVMNFESFLRVDHGLSNNSAEKLICIFKRIVSLARGNGLITVDPFVNYHIKVKRMRREFLTMEEVGTIMRKKFDSERLRKVKDIFVFCSFTGFAFADVSAHHSEYLEADRRKRVDYPQPEEDRHRIRSSVAGRTESHRRQVCREAGRRTAVARDEQCEVQFVPEGSRNRLRNHQESYVAYRPAYIRHDDHPFAGNGNRDHQ